jgi:hypothetical protein
MRCKAKFRSHRMQDSKPLEVGHQVVEEVLTKTRCPPTNLTTVQRYAPRSKTKVRCRSSQTVRGTKKSLLKWRW